MNLSQLRRAMYKTQRTIGDVQAAQRGPGALAKRLARRQVRRAVGRSMGRFGL